MELEISEETEIVYAIKYFADGYMRTTDSHHNAIHACLMAIKDQGFTLISVKIRD